MAVAAAVAAGQVLACTTHPAVPVASVRQRTKSPSHPPALSGGGATSEVRGNAHAMICKDNALDTASLTSFAIAIQKNEE